jgi:uncharacterized protein
VELLVSLRNYFSPKPEILFAYLFGSQVKGTANPDSDVDIAIYFQDDTFLNNHSYYLQMKVELGDLLKKEVDLVVLNTAKPLLKSRVINHHLKIFSRDTTFEGEFALRSLGEYFDIKPYLDLEYQIAVKKVKEELNHG